MLHGTQAGIAGSTYSAARSRSMALLFGAVGTESGAALGNWSIARLGCPADFQSSSPRTFGRTSREHELSTADLANTLARWTRSGYTLTIKRLSDTTWNGDFQTWPS